MDFDKQARELMSLALEFPDGFTVSIPDMEIITSGIAVGFADTQDRFDHGGAYYCYQHALYNYGYVGGWKNEKGWFQFDSIRIFTDLRAAVKWGRKQKQRAIFDIDNGWEIIL